MGGSAYTKRVPEQRWYF